MLTGESDPARWYGTNLVGIPGPLLGSVEFNAHPRRLRIAGARASSAGLFALLDQCGHADEAREVFEHCMELVFGLAKPAGRAPASENRRWKASYVKLLLVPGLLATRSLQGESEVLALGGDYEVEASYGV